MKFNCFLTSEEQADIESWIKEMEKDRDREFTESGGLGIRVQRFETVNLYEIYRVIGDILIKQKKE